MIICIIISIVSRLFNVCLYYNTLTQTSLCMNHNFKNMMCVVHVFLASNHRHHSHPTPPTPTHSWKTVELMQPGWLSMTFTDFRCHSEVGYHPWFVLPDVAGWWRGSETEKQTTRSQVLRLVFWKIILTTMPPLMCNVHLWPKMKLFMITLKV
jgi:hypothetical protein